MSSNNSLAVDILLPYAGTVKGECGIITGLAAHGVSRLVVPAKHLHQRQRIIYPYHHQAHSVHIGSS